MVHPPCPPWEILLWDSGFFACRIGRLNGGRLDAALLSAVDAWCREEAIDCLYFLADAEDPVVARTAEAAGFRLVDLRVTLDREMAALALPPVPDPAPHPTIRPARPEDLPALRRIAAAGPRHSRLYADPGFALARPH